MRDERRSSRPDLEGMDSDLVSSSSLGTDTQSPPVEVLENIFWWSPETSAFSAARRASRFATEEEVGASSCERSVIVIEGRSRSTVGSRKYQLGRSIDLNRVISTQMRSGVHRHIHLLSFMPASDSTKFPFLGVSANMVSTGSCSLSNADAISRVVLCIYSPWSCNSWNLETPRRSASKSRVSSGDSWATLFAAAIVARLEATRPARSLISAVTVGGVGWGGGIKRESSVGRTRSNEVGCRGYL